LPDRKKSVPAVTAVHVVISVAVAVADVVIVIDHLRK
jgi:hypothetical protein